MLSKNTSRALWADGTYQTPISGCLECFVLLATHFIDGLIEVLANMKPIMHVVIEFAEVMSARGNFFSTAFLYAFHMSTSTPVTCCCCSGVSDYSINSLGFLCTILNHIQHSALLQVHQAADGLVAFTEWLLINARAGSGYCLSP